MPHPCIIENCPNMVGDRSRFEECGLCRQVYRYWIKKTPGEVIERQGKLVKWQSRMVHLADQPMGRKYAKAIRPIKVSLQRRH